MYHMAGGCWKSGGYCGKCSSSRGGKDWQKHLEMPVEILDVFEVVSAGSASLICQLVM